MKKYGLIVLIIAALLGAFFVVRADEVRTEPIQKNDYTIRNVPEYDYDDITTYKVRLASGEKCGYILLTSGQWVIPQFDKALRINPSLKEEASKDNDLSAVREFI